MMTYRTLIFISLCLLSVKLLAQISDTNAINYYNLIDAAEKHYKNKAYAEALRLYSQALNTTNTNKEDYYNAACCASLAGDLDKAALFLNKSIDLGYWDLKWMSADADFNNLRQDRRWEKAIQKLNTTLNTIESKFERIKELPLTELIPYQENGLWGYIQRKSKEILVKAEFEKVSFAGNCLEIKQKQYNYSIGPDAKIQLDHNVFSTQSRKGPVYKVANFPTIVVDSSEGFKGFKVNEKGYISVVSKDFDQNNGKPLIAPVNPINIEGKMYAIVRKKGKYGLLDQEGTPHPKIGFAYKSLSPIFSDKKKCFLAKNESNQWGFIFSDGETKFQNEFDTLLRPEENYHFFSLNLVVVKKGDAQGVIDIPNMTWALKPTEQIEILNLGYTHKDTLCYAAFMDIDRSQILDFYFWVKNTNGQSYYLGKDQSPYLPK